MEFSVKPFTALTLLELYQVLRLRAEVFVVEQDCVYQDVDNKDQKALHVLGYKNNQIVAYTRIFDTNDYFEGYSSIGRVVVQQSERKYGYGHQLLQESIAAIEKHFNTQRIKISAQTYLEKFYNTHSFKRVGEEYLEDGIPHVVMIKS
ncbi:GNAT family N-acetyltransferase [Aquimarina brevivitae]|uniref:ElaA protein n=1 Tax=Aquimarina brevivitae TaxID=323412 RepID=A0A4Q7PK73_9FLAO|nr:GNAT family N-acetyltransferase [Aquimarina brevivitae]RZS99342.1 ElaA protein [Aquimarina brevivitae]